jgi:hypothetical protein
MSLPVRDALTYDPEATFTLEAATAKSRDQYERLGFKACRRIIESLEQKLIQAWKTVFPSNLEKVKRTTQGIM